MSLVEKIKMLCNEKRITMSELERKTDLGNGTISRWDTRTPGVDKLKKVADYFDVSTDYLLGRTDNPSIDKGEPEEEFSTFFRIDTKDIPEEDREKLEEELKEYFEFMKNRLKNKWLEGYLWI